MIKLCEEILLNSDPSVADLFENDFLIKMLSNQHPCMIHAIGDKKTSLADRIEYIEGLLSKKRRKPVYRILYTEEYRMLDEELFKQGYEKVNEGSVKYMDIRKIQKELFTFAAFIQNGVFAESSLESFWVDRYREFHGMKAEQLNIFVDNMRRSQEDFYYFTLMQQNTMIGLAYAAMDRGIFAIRDVVVAPRYQGLSYGRRLVMSMLSYAFKNEIEHVIIPIDVENEAANKLFNRIGFENAYHYWQRYKNILDK